ncbi:right-handed parallel beta-helix repeat-containing protein [bacterium]|nr:right-handed parallel beta-helix repeat-containing protein [bacterium]
MVSTFRILSFFFCLLVFSEQAHAQAVKDPEIRSTLNALRAHQDAYENKEIKKAIHEMLVLVRDADGDESRKKEVVKEINQVLRLIERNKATEDRKLLKSVNSALELLKSQILTGSRNDDGENEDLGEGYGQEGDSEDGDATRYSSNTLSDEYDSEYSSESFDSEEGAQSGSSESNSASSKNKDNNKEAKGSGKGKKGKGKAKLGNASKRLKDLRAARKKCSKKADKEKCQKRIDKKIAKLKKDAQKGSQRPKIDWDPTVCDDLKAEEILYISVGAGGSSPISTSHISKLPNLLKTTRANPAYAAYRRFHVTVSPETYRLDSSLRFDASMAPPCGLTMLPASGKVVLSPSGTINNWETYSDDIVSAQITGDIDVTGLSFDGQLLLRSRFPARNVNHAVDRILDLNPNNGTFLVEAGVATRLLEKAFSKNHSDKGDPELWIPGTGSIYSIDIKDVSRVNNGLLVKLDDTNKNQIRIALKCMTRNAQNTLSASERKLCRDDNVDHKDPRKQVWKGILPNHPYFVENHLLFISDSGEWAFNKKTKTIYLKRPKGVSLSKLNSIGVNLVSDPDEARKIQTLMKVDGLNFVTIQGFRFEGTPFVMQASVFAMARGAVSTGYIGWNESIGRYEKKPFPAAFTAKASNSLKLHQNEFFGLDAMAVDIGKGSSIEVSNNLFRDIGYSALEITGGDRIGNIFVNHNELNRIGLRGVGEGIRVDNAIKIHVDNNKIIGSSRGGIKVSGGFCGQGRRESQNSCEISINNNVIKDFASGGLSDYGGIYINNISFKKMANKWGAKNPNVKIVNNVVQNGRLPAFYPKDFEIEGPVGIYLDLGSKKVLVSKNKIKGVDTGINQNCAEANKWLNNKIRNSKNKMKAEDDYATQQEWAAKCVAEVKGRSKLDGSKTVIRNGKGGGKGKDSGKGKK